MKVCKLCKQEKELKDFHPNKTCKDGVVGTCRLCTSAKKRNWYKLNRKRRQELANNLNQSRKQEMVELFGNKCHDCHGTFPMCVYDFHHLDGSIKDMNPSKALTLSVERRMEELKKCILLCSNCHRIRHFGMKG